MWWQLGRWDTVKDMLLSMDAEDIVWARAAYETVPLDDGWKQADTVAGAMHNEFERYMTAKAGKMRVDPSRLHKLGDYIPKLRPKKQVTVNQGSIDYLQRMIEAQYGNR